MVSQVGDMFETTVKVSVASGGPVPLIKVKASITNILDGTLIQSVESFLTNVRAVVQPQAPPIVASQLLLTGGWQCTASFRRVDDPTAVSGPYLRDDRCERPGAVPVACDQCGVRLVCAGVRNERHSESQDASHPDHEPRAGGMEVLQHSLLAGPDSVVRLRR